MPLVFVHGVNTRYKPNPAPQDIQTRDGLFRQYALPDVVADPAAATVLNPYWGDYGATFAWDNASLPKEKYEPFGGGGAVTGFDKPGHEEYGVDPRGASACERPVDDLDPRVFGDLQVAGMKVVVD